MSDKRPRFSVKVRTNVGNRALWRCEYCKTPKSFSIQPYVIEHIIPISKGGSSEEDNLAYSCGGCNQFKYNKTESEDPINGELVPLFHPRADTWSDHFACSDDFATIIGLTPTGRATIVALKINRETVQNLRKVLLLVKEHPPPE